MKISFILAMFFSGAVFAADGKQIFSTNCVICHGATGIGDGPAAAALNPKPRNFTKDDFVNVKNKKKPTAKELVAVLKKGYKAMPPFGHLPEADLKAVAEYVISLRK